MASQYDASQPVGPGDDRTFKINLSVADEIVAGDTIASGTVTWGSTGAPSTVGSISGDDVFALVGLAGFTNGVTYYGTFNLVTSSGAKIDVFIQFVCAKPTGF